MPWLILYVNVAELWYLILWSNVSPNVAVEGIFEDVIEYLESVEFKEGDYP